MSLLPFSTFSAKDTNNRWFPVLTRPLIQNPTVPLHRSSRPSRLLVIVKVLLASASSSSDGLSEEPVVTCCYCLSSVGNGLQRVLLVDDGTDTSL